MSASSGYFSGREGGGRRRSADAALPGQEGTGVRLQKGSGNQHVVGGGTSFATAAVINDNPRASRSTAAAFFAGMDVWGSGAEEEVAATGGGGDDSRGWQGCRAGGYKSRCWTAR